MWSHRRSDGATDHGITVLLGVFFSFLLQWKERRKRESQRLESDHRMNGRLLASMSIWSNSLYARFLSLLLSLCSVGRSVGGTCGRNEGSGVGFALTLHFVTSPGGHMTMR